MACRSFSRHTLSPADRNDNLKLPSSVNGSVGAEDVPRSSSLLLECNIGGRFFEMRGAPQSSHDVIAGWLPKVHRGQGNVRPDLVIVEVGRAVLESPLLVDELTFVLLGGTIPQLVHAGNLLPSTKPGSNAFVNVQIGHIQSPALFDFVGTSADGSGVDLPDVSLDACAQRIVIFGLDFRNPA